ncbi:SGNH hydrolase domain-containing protein [Nocardioides salsibiostraticola]
MSEVKQGRRGHHRDDIQGIRALAVLAVMFNHASLGPLPGGYVGVDVFFVVSGFLITQLLLREGHRTFRVSLAGFYARRARRILPAASLVLVSTVVFSVATLSYLDSIRVAKDAVWSALFAANINFGVQGADYFSQDAGTSPLQHYWSLAVEEQFYVVWPLLISLAFLLGRRRKARPAYSLKIVMGTVLALAAASLAWSIYLTATSPGAAYFSTSARAWELALGAAVAVAVHQGRTLGPRYVREITATVGLLAIATAVLTYNETVTLPGYAALLPVLGTAGLLWSGAFGSTTWVGRALSVRPLREIGDWSYSLYLWHWPLLILPQMWLARELLPVETAFQIVVTFALAHFTYRYVETPFRRTRTSRQPRRALILYPMSLALVLPIALGGWAWADVKVSERGDEPAITVERFGLEPGNPEALVRASVLAGKSGWAIPSDLTPDLVDLNRDVAQVGDCDYTQDTRSLCPRGDPEGDKTLVLVGDSHARAWIPAFEHIAEAAGYRAYYLVKPQCTASLVAPARLSTNQPWPACTEFQAWVATQIADLKPDLVVASSTPPDGIYTDDGAFTRDKGEIASALSVGYADLFAAYTPHAGRVVLLEDVPRLPTDPGSCLSARDVQQADCLFERDPVNEQIGDDSATAAAIAGVDSVDPSAWFCADGLCPLVVGSTITYRDRGHITTERSAELAGPLADALGLIPDTASAAGTDSASASPAR